MSYSISSKALIGQNVYIGNNVRIGDEVIIGDNCSIGDNCIINYTQLDGGTSVEHNCTLGYANATGWVSKPTPAEQLIFDSLKIGENSLIREGSTLYKGSVLGNNVKIHHKVLIREKTIIGDHSSIGSMTDIEGHVQIGKYCSIHSNIHLCYDTVIGDYVFMAPFSITTNGNPMAYKRPQLIEKFGGEKGPVIGSGCQIAVHVVILPRVVIGHECIIGAAATVTKDAEPLSILIGSPAKKVGEVEELHRLPVDIRKSIGINL